MNGPKNTDKSHIDRPQVDQAVIDLLNGSIDGVLNDSKQQSLDNILTNSKHARDLYDELRTVARVMDEAPELDPPEHLQSSIERQVRLPVTKSRHSNSSGILGSWLSAQWFRTGFALTLGAVITVGVYQMGSGPVTTQDEQSMVGTVVETPSLDQPVLLGSIKLQNTQLNGQVELTSSNKLITLDVRLHSQLPSELVIYFDDRGLEFEGMNSNRQQQDIVSASGDSVKVTSSGPQSYTLSFRRVSSSHVISPLAFEFFAGNLLIHKEEVSVSPP